MNSGSKKRKRLTENEAVRFAGQRRRSRSGLMATTALQAGAIMLLAFPVRPQAAQAQPAPTARPQGGSVVAGQASIAQSTAQTTVAQSSQRAAIDWRSYDIGSAHTVTYQQPNASSITLNRVTGPDPSQIAGRIQANGQVAIVNGSGVVFSRGSQVDVQTLVVSSANVSNTNFMAGRMVFDQPGRADARISNEGAITVKATGLAALVAPQVQNSGTITAKLGHVVLAGAEAHTVDLYGDGLMSVDVTRQVQKAPNGANVLVTNSGVIAADGGTVVLTARAADGIVTNLVSNTGRLRANTVGDKTGTIVISAIGGSISVEGAIEANGRAPGAAGGTVQFAATDTVALGAGARVAANGRAGGGTIAVGTTPDRARNQGGGVPTGSARAVTVAAGARIVADGHGDANGGSIALLSTDNTSMAGAISARGGKRGGDGGQVEVSGAKNFALTGTVNVGAPSGKLGTILIDPLDLTITHTSGAADDGSIVSTGTAPAPVSGTVVSTQSPGAGFAISDTAINAFTGNVTLQASRDLVVSGGVTINLNTGTLPQALTLQAGNNLTVLSGATISASGPVTMAASSAAVTGATATGGATINGTLTSTGGLVRVSSDGAAGAVAINAGLSGITVQVAGAAVSLAGGVTATGAAQPIAINADSLTLATGAAIGTIANSGIGTGTVAVAPFTPNTALTIEAAKGATAGLSLTPADLALLAPASAVARLNLGDTTGTPASATATAGSIALNAIAPIGAPTLGLYSHGAITQTAPLTAGTLTGASSAATTLNLANAITTFGSFTAGTSANVAAIRTLTVAGPVSGQTVQVSAPNLILAGTLTSAPAGVIGLNADALTLNAGTALSTTGGTVAVAPLTAGTALTIEASKGFTSGLSLTPADIALLSAGGANAPASLILGNTAAVPTAATATAGSIALNTPVTVNAPTIGLYSAGTITGGATLTAGTLTGASTGATTLTASNAIGSLGSFASGALTVLDGPTPLTITGPVVSTGDIFLQSAANLSTAGNVSATGNVRLRTGASFTQSAGIVAAGAGSIFVTDVSGDLAPTTGAISQTGGTLAAATLARLYTRTDATFSGGGTIAGSNIEILAPLGINGFPAASGPTTGLPTITTGAIPTVTLAGRPASLLLDGATLAIARPIAADTIELHSTGNTTEPGGSLTANTLTGTAGSNVTIALGTRPVYTNFAPGSALLSTPGNAVGTLGTYSTNDGFTLDNGTTALTANAAVTTINGAVALRAGRLTLNGATLNAPRIELASDALADTASVLTLPATGTLALAPYTSGAYTIGVPLALEPAITGAQILTLLPATSIGTLQLGTTSATPSSAIAPGTPNTATTLTVNDTLNSRGRAGTLGLYGSTAVAETGAAGHVTAGTVTGAAGNQFQLDASTGTGPFYGLTYNNAITTLGAITAGTAASVASSSNLSTTAATTITAAAGNVTLTSLGTLTLNGTAGAGSGIGGVTVQATSGVTESNTGIIQTGTLSGAVGDASTAITVGRNATLNGGNLVANLGSFSTAQGNFGFNDAQALTVLGTATVTGRNVTLTTTGSATAMTVNGAIGACATAVGVNGNVTLTPIGPLTIGPGAVVGGENTTLLSGASNTITGGFVEAGRSGTPTYAGTITATNGLSIQGGTVAASSIISAAGITQSGGTLAATTLTASPYAFSGGQIYSATGLNLNATSIGPTDVISAPNVAINAAAGFTSAGDVFASIGNVQIALAGGFTQTAGRIAAANAVTIAGNIAGSSATTSAAPGAIQQTGGTLAAGSTGILLDSNASAAVTIAGFLASPLIQVIEPNATLSVAPLTIAGAGTASAPGYSVQFHCPGCDGLTPTLAAIPGSLMLSGTSTNLRVDANVLRLTAPIAATTTELHSVANTSQTAPLTTTTLLGTAGYAVTLPTTGLPTWSTPTTAGAATLTTSTNAITTLGPYYAGGSLAVASGAPSFTVSDYLVAGGGQSIALTNTTPGALLAVQGPGAGSGQLSFGTLSGGAFTTNSRAVIRGVGTLTPSTLPSTVTLVADQLSLTGGGAPVVSAPGGTVSIAPLTAGRALSIDATRNLSGTLLSLGTTDLALISTLGTGVTSGTGTLRLGSVDGTLTNAAGSLAVNGPLALSNLDATLALYAQNAITEPAATGRLTIGRSGVPGTLTGAAGGTVSLGTVNDVSPPNHFDVLGPFTAGTGLSVSDSPDANAGRGGMTVQGTINPGAGPLGLLDVGQILGGTRLGGTVALGSTTTAATLNAPGQTVTLIAQNGPANAAAISETAGSVISANVLTGRASTTDLTASGYDVLLNTGLNNQVATLGQFIVGAGAPGLVSAQGAFRLKDAASLAITGQVTAKSAQITANTMTVVGDIGACAIGGAGGDVRLAAGLGAITINSGTIGGQTSISFANDVVLNAGTVNAPSIAITGALTENGGALSGGSVSASGGSILNGGLLHATTLNATPVTYAAGDLYADNALTVTVPGTSFAGTIGSGAGLTVNATGALSSTGTLYSGGSLTLNVGGDFTQSAGIFGAHTDLSVLATGIASQSAGTIEAGGTLLVRASGAAGTTASVLGTLSAQTVQLIEPGYGLAAAPAVLGGAYAVNVGPLANIYHCPGCDAFTAVSTYPITLPTLPGSRPVNLRLDGNSLALGTLSADSVELHSVGATTQTGPLSALTLTGTAGYPGTAATLPVYTPGIAQLRLAPTDSGYIAPGYTVVTPPTGGAVTLTNPANNIFGINGYQIAGDTPSGAGFTLIDRPAAQTNAAGVTVAATGLTLTGTVRAGPATDPLDATAEAASGAPVAITTNGVAGALQVNGTLAGRSLTLNTSGPITETGTLVASSLTGTAPSATLATPNQLDTLNQFTVASGNLTLLDARTLLVNGEVAAPFGNAAITAQPGTGAVSAKEPGGVSIGDLILATPPAGSLATVTAGNTILAGVDVIVGGLIGACTLASAATGNVSIAATAGTITVNPGAIIGGQTSATLTAPAAVLVQGGTVNAPTVTIGTLTLTAGQVFGNTVNLNGGGAMTGGTLNAATLNAPAGFSFSGGSLYAGNAATISAGPILTGLITTGGTLTINGATIADTANLFGATVAINTTGDFQQQSGLIAATGNVGITAGGLITQSPSAQLEAGNTVLLRASGSGSATIQGQLAAGQIDVVEPGAALSFTPNPFIGTDTHPLRGAATVTLGTLSNTFACPGCVPATAAVSSAGTPAATPGPYRPAGLRLDGNTIALGGSGSSLVLAADSVELHSLGATTQPGGSLEAATLLGTAGYAGTTALLPLYTIPPAQTRTAAGYTIAPVVTGATVTLDNPANNIIQIAGYLVRGDDLTRGGLTLVDTPVAQTNSTGTPVLQTPLFGQPATAVESGRLLLTGPVQAGPSSDPLDASAAAATGNAVSIRVTGMLQFTPQIAVPLIYGDTVTLNASAAINEGTSSGFFAPKIVAGTLTGSAGGDVLLGTSTTGGAGQVGNQIGTLAAFSAPAGSFSLQNSRNLTVTGPVSAQSGITITAQSGTGTPSVPEGQSAGNLTLAGILTSGADISLTAYGTLTGSAPSAPGTLTLNAGGNVAVSGIAAGRLTGNAGQSFTASGNFLNASSTSAVNGALTLSDTNQLLLAGTSRSQLGTLITAPTVTATGELDSVQAIQLHVTGSDFTQTAGTIAAGTTLVVSGAADTTPLAGAISQQSGQLAAGASVRLLATGDASQFAAGSVLAPVVQAVSFAGGSTFGASQSATIAIPPASVDLTGVVPTFTSVSGTVTPAGRPASVRLDGATVTLNRPTAGDAVEIHATGNLLEAPGGTITANTLQGTAGYAPSGFDAQGLPTYATLDGTNPGAGTASLGNANTILRLGPFQARSGLSLTDGAALTIAGAVRSGLVTDPLTGVAADATGAPLTINLTGPAATLAIGDAASPTATLAGGLVTLTLPGTLSQAPGALLVASTLTGNSSMAALNAPNQVVRLGAYTTTGNLSLYDAVDLQVTGPVIAGPTPPVGATPVLALTTSGNLDVGGGSLTAGSVVLSSAGATTETNGSIVASTLTATASQFTANGGSNQITSIASLIAPAGIALTDAIPLTTAGPVTAARGSVAVNAAGALTEAAASTITGTAVALTSGAPTTLSGTTIATTGPINVNVTGDAVLGGTESAAGPISITASSNVAISGAITSQTDAITLTATGGTITQSGNVNAATAVTLAPETGLVVTSGSTTSAGTTLAAGTPSVRIAGAATLAGSMTAGGALSVYANGITVSGPLLGKMDAVTLDAGSGAYALLASGTVTGNAVTTQSGGTTTLSGITTSINGPINLTANGLEVGSAIAGGAVTLQAGTGPLTQSAASTITGTALVTNSTGPTTLSGTTNANTINLTASGDLVLSPGGNITGNQSLVATSTAGTARLAGVVTSPLLVVNAPSIVLQGGTLTVGGTAQPSGVSAAGLPTKTTTLGAYFETGTSFVQAGPTTITAQNGTNATVRVDLKNGTGSMTFSSLYAPSSNLILDLGSGSGTGQNITVKNLAILYAGTAGVGNGTLNLNNVTIGAQTGTGAAGAALAFPASSRNYRINACAVASVNCVVLRPEAVPVGNPLKELSLSFFNDQDDDRDLLVPNISDQGL